MRLSGSVKLRCDLGSGWSDGGAAGLPGFLRLSAWRCCSFSASATLFRRRQPGVGLQRRHRLLDLRQPFLLVAGPIRHLVAALVSAESLVLFGIRRRAGRQHASDLGFQFRLAFLHALITHRFMFRRVRFDLRAIKRDMAEFDQPCRLAQLQNLQEQRAERLQMPLAEVADRAKIRRIERHNHHKIVPFAAGLRDPSRRIQPARIAVQQKRHHHLRVKRRLPKTTHIAARDLLEIKALPHQLNDKPRDMAFRHEVLHIRRQQQCLIDIPGAKILAHSSSLNQTRSKLNSDYSDRLLGSAFEIGACHAASILPPICNFCRNCLRRRNRRRLDQILR